MDVTDSTKIVYSRIQQLEPENVIKIIGYLLLQDHAHEKVIEYAFGTDKQIHNLINDAKVWLAASPRSNIPAPIQPIPNHPLQYMPSSAVSRPFSSPSSFRVPAPFPELHLPSELQPAIQDFELALPYPDLIGEDYHLQNQNQFLSLEEQLNPVNPLGPDFSSNYYYQEAALAGGIGSRTTRRSTSLTELPKACHYFYKGYCKHGTNCRYFHGQTIPDSLSQIYSPHLNEFLNDDHAFVPGSLEKLEIEITELLQERRGVPVSIASLPMLYHEKFGRTLQAEGYLTESQRHGKAGYSLTKLLARLKNNIRLIDRPHGQHSVVLAEDAQRYMECRSERSDLAVVASSHQIYLTFPAESTFTEEDVSNYFKQYGPVRDVRIPLQQKRMFGFVSFMYPETVKHILTMGHPHYIRGARVLVKPYREKTRIVDRKYPEKNELPMYYPSQYVELETDYNAMPRVCDKSSLLRRQLIEEQEQALELERMRLCELQLTPKPLTQHPFFSYRMEEDSYSYSPNFLNNGSTINDKARHTSHNYSDQDSGQIELPDSPFASPRIGSGISTAI